MTLIPLSVLQAPKAKAAGFRVSVIIPVLNEAALLPRLIQRLRDGGPPDLEIVVVDGGSQDESRAVAASLADKATASSHPCRACQMDRGARAAAGDLLLFLHADTLLPDGWPDALLAAWNRRPPPAATAFGLGFDDDGRYFRLMSVLADWRAHWITGVPHGDQAIAVHRDVYLAAGGFPHVPLMEEYALMRRLRGRGPVRILPQRVRTSARRYRKNGPLFTNLRNLLLIALFHLGVPVRFLARMYK